MIKLQQFWQLSFTSDRLKKVKWDLDLSLEQARKNSEVISVNNSELLRTLFRIKGIDFSQKVLNSLFYNKKKLKKLQNSEENRQKLLEIEEKIEKMLYIEDFVSIEFVNKKHYLQILKMGYFQINGTKFVPFMASAGQIRKNTALFVNRNYKDRLLDILENGRNKDVPLVEAKYGAYFSLYGSSTLPVSFPRFAVVPDKTIETTRRVDFVEYQGVDVDDSVTEKDYVIKANAFDGQGLISPTLAEKWSTELELDYVFSSAIIRAPFLKGLVVTFDFEKFAEEKVNTHCFVDIYGNTVSALDVDMIVSESMFKLWQSYDNTESYISNCQDNKLGFSIAKVNPKRDRAYSKTSYQFLQVLKLDDVDIANLCEPTINWFRDLSGGDADKMLLYAMGESNFEPKYFSKLDLTTQAVIINPAMSRDRHVQARFIKTLEKKKKDSYMGSVLINANYSFMISDPYYQACHVFSLSDKPLLNDSEHYSEYWINRDVLKVAAIRSPIVHHSEVNILNFKDNDDTRRWYQYIHSGTIYPAFGIGIDTVLHGGSD